MSVRLIQAGSEEDFDMFRLSRQPSAAPLDLIMWPEYSYVSDPRRTSNVWRRLTSLPREKQCWFLFGAKDQLVPGDEDAYRNTAFLIAPSGLEQGRHVKIHTVHFFRDGIPGKLVRAIATPLGRLGVGICFDMDYPDVARRLVNDGAEVLLVPSDNPLEWGPLQHIQHRQLFQMRAVECGRWLATTDVAGSTFVVAPTGRIVRSVNTPEPTLLDVTVGRTAGRTLFARGGWRFGQLCLATLAALILFGPPAGPRALSITLPRSR
jgi:apolipoprotein N-acyltransferase